MPVATGIYLWFSLREVATAETIGGRANAEKATEGKMEETLETVGKGKRLGWMEHMLAWARVVARLPQADGGWGFEAVA